MRIEVQDGVLPMARVTGVLSMPAAREWLTANRNTLHEALLRHGSLLIRGLPVNGTADFAVARDILIEERASYREKATPRSDHGDDVFSSTDMPAMQEIRLHNENSYTLEFPGLLLFGCLTPPAGGGATPVADSRAVLAGLSGDVAERFRAGGWVLRRTFHPHVSLPWSTAFGTDDPAAVQEYCEQNLIAYRWQADDGLLTSQRRPATIHHPVTGEEVWFNHIAFWNEYSLDPDVREVLVSSYGEDNLPFQTRHGDGGRIEPEVIAEINAAYDQARRRIDWQRGDLMLVDNILASHGREPFRGDRRIVVAMGRPTRMLDCSPSVPPAPGGDDVER